MPDEPDLEVRIDPAMEGGVYANALSVMFSGHEMTLDFAVSLPAEQRYTPDGQAVSVMPWRVTARVRIAPTVAFDLMRTLEANMTAYEEQFGEIRRLGPEVPLYPPDDYPGDQPQGGQGDET